MALVYGGLISFLICFFRFGMCSWIYASLLLYFSAFLLRQDFWIAIFFAFLLFPDSLLICFSALLFCFCASLFSMFFAYQA
jgi:hypothetical protein